MKKLKIIVTGFIGLYPTGGVTWDYIQYPIGLRKLGHDVYYIEDTGQYSNYRITSTSWDDPRDSVEYLRQTMEFFGFKERWAYRDTFSGKCYGIPLSKLVDICSSADIFINISDAAILRDEYIRIPRRVLIDSDPMFTQLQVNEKPSADARYPVSKFDIQSYTHHFSFGENIGNPDCKIPTLGINWVPTRQPVCLDLWQNNDRQVSSQLKNLSTVMNWSTRTKLHHAGESWGQKDVEFKKFISLPMHFPDIVCKIAMAASAAFKKDVDISHLENYGWEVYDAGKTVSSIEDYQQFLLNSDAEFSVAKESYVKSNSGWFSCRSACYLALGKPVITQETKWSSFIPSGSGLFAFHDVETAIYAVNTLCSNYSYHAKAATEIARYFNSDIVLSDLLEMISISKPSKADGLAI